MWANIPTCIHQYAEYSRVGVMTQRWARFPVSIKTRISLWTRSYFGVGVRGKTGTMRFYRSFTSSVLILIYLFSDNVLGAPQKGRYMWLKCNPDSQKANCMEKKGPSIDLFGKPHRISSRAENEIDPVKSSEESSDTEESGDGSGDLFNVIEPESRRVRESGPENQIQNGPEGSGDELKYDNYIYPVFGNSKLSDEDLREDNIIE